MRWFHRSLTNGAPSQLTPASTVGDVDTSSAQRDDVAHDAPRHRVGIFAAIIALGLTIAGAYATQAYAVSTAQHYLQAVAAQAISIKWEGLTFQRAAYASGTTLPIYGSSELYCCGDPAMPTQIFGAAPSGFRVFPVGRAGTGDLFFVQTFAALGGDLHGKKLVISDSPGWFFGPLGMGDEPYAGNFSPEIAEAFVFDSPISLETKRAGATRMLDHKGTPADQPLLRLATGDLADPTPAHLARYWTLYPAGRVFSLIHQVQDATDTLGYIRDHPALVPDLSKGPPNLPWAPQLAAMTAIAQQRATTNPFGFPDATYKNIEKDVKPALDAFCAGKNNHDGAAFAYPSSWDKNMLRSKEWTDLELELRVLRELGAQPFVYTLPMPGTYDDFTSLSYSARRSYYSEYAGVASAAGVPWLTFQEHDGDRFFLTDTGAHFSPRGWTFAGRAIDLYWHDASIEEIRASMADLLRTSPAAPPPTRAAFCPQPVRK